MDVEVVELLFGLSCHTHFSSISCYFHLFPSKTSLQGVQAQDLGQGVVDQLGRAVASPP